MMDVKGSRIINGKKEYCCHDIVFPCPKCPQAKQCRDVEATSLSFAVSTLNQLDMGIYFDNNEFLVMDVVDASGNIVDQAVMQGIHIVHI